MGIVAIGDVARKLGVSVLTIRRWHREGKLLPSFATIGGHRRYDIEKVKMQFEIVKDDRLTIGYCRVSTRDF